MAFHIVVVVNVGTCPAISSTSSAIAATDLMHEVNIAAAVYPSSGWSLMYVLVPSLSTALKS